PEPVEAAVVAVVLGQVHVAGTGVDGHGLVREPPGRGDRQRGGDAPTGVRGHEEDVAVLAAPAVVGARDRLLAGDPAGVTVGDAAGAVGERAAEAGPVAHHPAPAGVEQHRHGAAHADGVVATVLGHLHRPRHRAG